MIKNESHNHETAYTSLLKAFVLLTALSLLGPWGEYTYGRRQFTPLDELPGHCRAPCGWLWVWNLAQQYLGGALRMF